MWPLFTPVEQDMADLVADVSMPYPCLITVEKDIFRPRLPAYTLLKRTEGHPIRTLALEALPCGDKARYGLLGSPTRVERMFPPDIGASAEWLTGDSAEVADQILGKLRQLKLLYY